jgi:hypothetical protein
MKNINNAYTEVKTTDWFSKLAALYKVSGSMGQKRLNRLGGHTVKQLQALTKAMKAGKLTPKEGGALHAKIMRKLHPTLQKINYKLQKGIDKLP